MTAITKDPKRSENIENILVRITFIGITDAPSLYHHIIYDDGHGHKSAFACYILESNVSTSTDQTPRATKTMTNIFVVAAKRTPFGAFGGSLKSLSSTELGAIATRSALASANLDASKVDAVYFGNVIQSSSDAAYLARHVGLTCGVPISSPALTINRLCGSGFETVIQGAKSIRLKEAQIVVCGGAENMSMAPLQVDGNDARWGVPLGSGLKMRDSLWDGLTDQFAGTPMGITAENLAEKYGISREVSAMFCLCK